MNDYTALTITVPLEHEEDVKGYLLVTCDVEGFEEASGGGLIVYISGAWSELQQRDVETTLQQLNAKLLHVEQIQNKDWNAAWEASIEPLAVTDELVISPSWKLREAQELGANYLLTIDPKMSFGTGHHETTRLCLRLIETLACEGKDVLDVGTGTGALAMYAILRGAKHAVGIDTDEWSYQNAQENRERNAISPYRFDIRLGDLKQTVTAEESFDILIANIHRNVLLALAQDLYEHVRTSGKLILSGLLTYDAAEIRQAYTQAGFAFELQAQEQEWVALLFSKH